MQLDLLILFRCILIVLRSFSLKMLIPSYVYFIVVVFFSQSEYQTLCFACIVRHFPIKSHAHGFSLSLGSLMMAACSNVKCKVMLTLLLLLLLVMMPLVMSMMR